MADKAKILIVEDEEILLAALKEELSTGWPLKMPLKLINCLMF